MRILDNWGKKALCFFAFAILCALSAYAESCSTSGQLRYSASGCSYTTEICCHGAWTSGATCTECSSDQCWNGSSCVSKPSTAPYMLNNTTTPTAAQYKSNASVCVFNWKCYNGTGWLSNMGSGLNYCACVGGYSWDSSSQTCKQNASTSEAVCSTNVSKTVAGSSQAQAISLCKSGPYATERTGRLGAGQTEGGRPTCPGSKGTFTLSCSAELNSSGKWQYIFTSTVCTCQTK